MSVKISIFKSSADGEQTNVEYTLEKRDYDRMVGTPARIVEHRDGSELIPGTPGESLRHILDPYFRLMDDRLREMNLRIMIANTMVKALPVEAQMAFHNVQDVIHGQRPSSPEYSELLKQVIEEVVKKLVVQGVPEPQIRESVEASFGKQDQTGLPKAVEVADPNDVPA